MSYGCGRIPEFDLRIIPAKFRLRTIFWGYQPNSTFTNFPRDYAGTISNWTLSTVIGDNTNHYTAHITKALLVHPEKLPAAECFNKKKKKKLRAKCSLFDFKVAVTSIVVVRHHFCDHVYMRNVWVLISVSSEICVDLIANLKSYRL